MFALRTQRYAFFLVLSLALGAVTNVEVPSGKEFDPVCSNAAKEDGVANPDNWVWSAADATCVNLTGDPVSGGGYSTDSDLVDTTTDSDDTSSFKPYQKNRMAACPSACRTAAI